jgi:hypothetical protein
VGSRATAEGRWKAARRWASAAGSLAAARRWAAVAAVGSCGSPWDKVAVAVLLLCGRGCQNESSQRARELANLLWSMLGRSRLL